MSRTSNAAQLIQLVKQQQQEIFILKQQVRRLEDHSVAVRFVISAMTHVIERGKVAPSDGLAVALRGAIDEARAAGRSEDFVSFLKGIYGLMLVDPALPRHD